jgi:hypothetical protein
MKCLNCSHEEHFVDPILNPSGICAEILRNNGYNQDSVCNCTESITTTDQLTDTKYDESTENSCL